MVDSSVQSRPWRIMLEKVADSAFFAPKLAEPYKPYGGQFLEFCSISLSTYQTCMKLTRKSTEFCQFFCRHYPPRPSPKWIFTHAQNSKLCPFDARLFFSNVQHERAIVPCTVLANSIHLWWAFYYFETFYFFHLSHMILEVELTRNIDIKNDGLIIIIIIIIIW